jgi:branched-chain amino acid transport system permease protein
LCCTPHQARAADSRPEDDVTDSKRSGIAVNIAQLLNGLALGSLLMLLSAGLALIYGLRGVFNFAHGALYMLGAYVTYTVATDWSFWLALIVAPIVLVFVGVVFELGFLRWVAHRDHLEVGLMTFGLALMVTPLVIKIWGAKTLPVAAPAAIGGTTSLLGVDYPTYRLFIIGVAVLVAVALTLWLQRSRVGLHIRAASHNRESAAILGVNTDRVSVIVVSLGAALAGLAGALVAPFQAVNPGMGTSIIVIVLIVVVIGGIGSIAGAMIASMAMGIAQTASTVWVPGATALIPYVALVLVLLIKPTGLAGKRLS